MKARPRGIFHFPKGICFQNENRVGIYPGGGKKLYTCTHRDRDGQDLRPSIEHRLGGKEKIERTWGGLALQVVLDRPVVLRT